MEAYRSFSDPGPPDVTKVDITTPSMMSAFSALNLLRYNHLLAQSEVPGVRYPVTVGPECLLPPRNLNLCVPTVQHYSPPPFLHLDSSSGVISVCSQKKRGEKRAIPDEQKDERYYERRKRNNQAAKKSRDARRLREDQIAMRALHLEHENAMLTAQNLTLRDEISTLRQLILKCNKASSAN
ncbi:hepatic leukemia factor [Macrosteles quadrilineatus]|uniref:hepatic leukemia factor n=1 Tax=Macrosteles quadrilineatus TaxID=74068 RepID=UPI0023E2AE23|nr:hepatic leukemia factor [Macrosteles quadrilineatus]